MAVQQRRGSRTRKAKRQTHYKLYAPTLVICPNCGEYKKPHFRCACEDPNHKAEKKAEKKANKKANKKAK